SFFFSSRRRHTRSKRDWSSDVCSSDLAEEEEAVDGALEALDGYIATLNEALSSGGVATEDIGDYSQGEALEALREDSSALKHDEIGRASCREREKREEVERRGEKMSTY